jgi:hypothetical protein
MDLVHLALFVDLVLRGDPVVDRRQRVVRVRQLVELQVGERQLGVRLALLEQLRVTLGVHVAHLLAQIPDLPDLHLALVARTVRIARRRIVRGRRHRAGRLELGGVRVGAVPLDVLDVVPLVVGDPVVRVEQVAARARPKRLRRNAPDVERFLRARLEDPRRLPDFLAVFALQHVVLLVQDRLAGVRVVDEVGGVADLGEREARVGVAQRERRREPEVQPRIVDLRLQRLFDQRRAVGGVAVGGLLVARPRFDLHLRLREEQRRELRLDRREDQVDDVLLLGVGFGQAVPVLALVVLVEARAVVLGRPLGVAPIGGDEALLPDLRGVAGRRGRRRAAALLRALAARGGGRRGRTVIGGRAAGVAGAGLRGGVGFFAISGGSPCRRRRTR